MKKSLILWVVSFISLIPAYAQSAVDSAQAWVLDELVNELDVALYQPYLDEEKEPSKIGSITFSWDSTLINQDLNIRYRYQGNNTWIYSQAVAAAERSITLDSIEENRFFEWSMGSGDRWTEVQMAQSLGTHIFDNFKASGREEEVELSWSLDYDVVNALRAQNMKAVIAYNTDIGKKRQEEGMTGSEWMYTDAFEISRNKLKISDLVGNESYHFKIGFSPTLPVDSIQLDNPAVVWSKSLKVKTKRGWGITKFLILLGSLAFFIYGMKLMSEGLQQAAGNMLRSMLKSITSNRFKGVLTGFGITGLVQSSSVTTVMTVSFVNAGLMSLRQSAGVMMGANVGTTVTAWIILYLGFKVSVGSYAYMLLGLTSWLLFVKKGKARSWATAIVGFCILFIGLSALKDAVPDLDKDSGIVQFFLDFKDVWYGPVMFVFLGALVTIIIQSSSAAMALTLALVAKGAIPFDVACAMVLGENIGTTITAELASLIANVHAKRSARIHSMFNIVGVTWMLLIFHFFLGLVGKLISWSGGVEFDPTDVGMAVTGIALFHTMFNLTNVLALISFVPQLVGIAERTVVSKGDTDEEFKLDFIGGPLGSTAELSVLEAKKEISKFGTVTARMNGFVKQVINSSDRKNKNRLFSKLEKYEEITDRVEVEIAEYLTRATQLEMSERTSNQMRSMLSITNELERVGDIFFQISKWLEKKEEEKIYFTPDQREGLNNMLDLIEQAFVVMNENLEANYGSVSLDKAMEVEEEINKYRNRLRKRHLRKIEKRDFHMQGSLMYANLFSSLEKIGDHIINVTEALVGEV